MKRKKMSKVELKARFNDEKIEHIQLNYLMGGDDTGGQGSTEPWPGP